MGRLRRDSIPAWAIVAGAVVLAFLLGRWNAGGSEERPGSVEVVDRVVDTVVRIVERQPVRVSLSPPVAPSGPERAVTDTVWLVADTVFVIDTLAVEQDFAAVVDTIVASDTIRVVDSIRVRAGRGPISIAQLKSRIRIDRPADSLFDTRQQIIIKSTEYRNRPWTETVGIGAVGAGLGVLALIIVREVNAK